MADSNPFLEGISEKPIRTNSMTDEERLIVQNLFDTQPKKRKQYMKQLGFELDPKDTNKYRPIGSDETFDREIDPGVSAYFKPGGLKELARDFGDISYDTLVSLPIVSGSSVAGGAATAGLGTPGAAPGIMTAAALGMITGGAVGNAVSEELKKQAGDLVLDNKIPQDYKLMAVQSLITGMMGPIAKFGKFGGLEVQKLGIEARKKAIINAATASGNGLTPKIMNEAAEHPEMFTKEATAHATQQLSDLHRDIFGTSVEKPKTTRQITGGKFAEVVKPLNEAADVEINRLAQDPNANFKVSEIVAPIDKQINLLAQKGSRSIDENAALKYLRNKRSEIVGPVEKQVADAESKVKLPPIDESKYPYGIPDYLKPESPRLSASQSQKKIMDSEIDFKKGRDILKAIQTDAFDKEVPGNAFLRQAVGGREDALRSFADQKAKAVGSNLPEINAERSQILNQYNNMRDILTPQNITSAFIGDDNVRKTMIREGVSEMDRILKTNYSPAIESGQMQRVVQNMYQNPKSFGSGRVVPEMVRGAAKEGLGGAAAGMGAGFMVGAPTVGAVIGGTAGAIRGAQRAAALSSPERALSTLADVTKQGRELDQMLASPMSVQAGPVGQLGVMEGLKALSPKTDKDKLNPFLEGVE